MADKCTSDPDLQLCWDGSYVNQMRVMLGRVTFLSDCFHFPVFACVLQRRVCRCSLMVICGNLRDREKTRSNALVNHRRFHFSGRGTELDENRCCACIGCFHSCACFRLQEYTQSTFINFLIIVSPYFFISSGKIMPGIVRPPLFTSVCFANPFTFV